MITNISEQVSADLSIGLFTAAQDRIEAVIRGESRVRRSKKRSLLRLIASHPLVDYVAACTDSQNSYGQYKVNDVRPIRYMWVLPTPPLQIGSYLTDPTQLYFKEAVSSASCGVLTSSIMI